MSLVRIQPLIAEGKEILPAFSLDREISNYGKTPLAVYKTAPTLAQLRHAYETSSAIKANVLANRYRGEWTATFLRDGKEAIERPDNVFYDERRGLWIAEGGKVTRVELPNEGWALEYDKSTGFPSRTGNRKAAEKVFGDDASYFWIDKSGLRAVRRGFYRFYDDDSPFDVAAGWRPDFRSGGLGSRSVVQGSEQVTENSIEADYGKLPFEEFAAKYIKQ